MHWLDRWKVYRYHRKQTNRSNGDKAKALGWTSEEIVFIAVMLLVSAFLYQSQYRMYNLKQLNLEIEEARNKAERAAKAKSSFLAAMSHELRTHKPA